jgi:hypothetical protein
MKKPIIIYRNYVKLLKDDVWWLKWGKIYWVFKTSINSKWNINVYVFWDKVNFDICIWDNNYVKSNIIEYLKQNFNYLIKKIWKT